LREEKERQKERSNSEYNRKVWSSMERLCNLEFLSRNRVRERAHC